MLVKILLQSSLFISLASVLSSLHAATIPVSASTTASGFNDYQFTVNATLTIPDNININNTAGVSVQTTVLDKGTLLFEGSSVVTGSVGVARGNKLSFLRFDGGLGDVVSFQGNVEATNLFFRDPGTVIFEQQVGTLFPVSIDAREGKVIFKNQANIELGAFSLTGLGFEAIYEAPVYFSNEFAAFDKAKVTLKGGGSVSAGHDIRIFQDAEVNFEEDYTIGQDLVFVGAGRASLSSGKTVTILKDLMIDVPDAKFIFDLNLTATPGEFVAGNSADIQGDEIVQIINPGLASYAIGINGPRVIIASLIGNTITGIPRLEALSNLFISFYLSVNLANDLLELNAIRVIPTELENDIAGVAGILGTIQTTNAPNEFIDLANQLGLYENIAAQKKALASAAPMNDSAFHQVITDIQQNAFDLFSKRIEEQFIQLGNYHTGYAAGLTDEYGNGSWVKLFGSNIKQGVRQNINGYTAGVWGIALGVDSKISDTSLLGASFSWATASVSHDIGGSSTNINHYQGALYASKNNDNAYFFNGMLSLAYNQYDAAHRIVINNFNRTNFAHFHGWQYAARLESGYHYKLKQDLFEIQPILSLNYTHASFSAYQEKGRSLTAQKIEYESMNTLMADAGIKLLNETKSHDHTFIREAHVSLGYDLIGDRQKTTAQYIGFGSAYTMDGFAPARTYYNLGLSLTTYGHNNINVSLGYDYFWKQNYQAHSGFLKVKYSWH